MILAIDHIAFSSPDFERDIGRFEALGYQIQFRESRLKDLENKRGLMREFTGNLDMALLQRQGSIGIEVLDHGHVVPDPSYVLPVLVGAPAHGAPTGDALTVHGSSVVKVRTAVEEFFVQEAANGTAFRCDQVVVDADEMRSAVEFWIALGFKPLAVGGQIACLEFRSLLGGATVQMHVRQPDRRPRRFWLDTLGFNCLAFFSSDARKDHTRFMERGMRPTELNRFHVNRKDLWIFWVIGPGGEIAEIIGLA